MTTVTDTTPRRSLWFLMPIVLLGGLLTILAAMVVIATNDDGFAIEPDYYSKATRWDETSRAREASQRLGWQHRVVLSRTREGTRVAVSLVDRSGAPVNGASVAVEAFPNAHASEIHRLTLRADSPGRYTGDIVNARGGLWEVRLDVSAPGGERYLKAARVDVDEDVQ